MGSVYEWDLGLVSRLWLHVGLGLPVGLDAIPQRQLAIRAWIWLGMAAGRTVDGVELFSDNS